MDSNSADWGHFEITLDMYMKQHGISKYKLANAANLQKTQLTSYYRNQVQRPDLNVLSRICLALECEISDILKYVPPKAARPHTQALQELLAGLQESDQTRSYRTTDLARELDIHPNTVRFYENAGLISTAPRAKNGYRIFNIRHLYQLKVCRCIYGAIWTGRTIRASAMKILEAMRDWDIKKAMLYAKSHLELVEKEYSKALETSVILKQWADESIPAETGKHYSRRETSTLIGVTPEILRNWERNNLITVPRTGASQTRFYTEKEIARLRVIYMLRQTSYSISAIHRSLSLHDHGNTAGALLLLNQPEPDEEITYTSAGDHWIDSLVNAAESARKIMKILKEIVL